MKKVIAAAVAMIFGAVMAVSAADAKENWDKQCAKCHGKEGKGDSVMGKKLNAKDYSDAKVQAELKDDEMAKAIKDGVKKDGKQVMKPSEGLSDDDIKALVKLIRDFKK